MSATRLEHDLLGDHQVPIDAYWGVHTARAVENFPISGVPIGHYRSLIRALAIVKHAAAKANFALGELDEKIADAISKACEEVAEGQFDIEFVVDAIQGGAGTSTNMNANEVIANRAIEHLGGSKGEYSIVHPLNHVNKSQSTNDVYPTALKLALIIEIGELLKAMTHLQDAFQAKADEFKDVIKMGRTQLQDAVPMTLGQEFASFSRMTMEDIQRLREVVPLLREINLGGTAIGTGLNAPIGYSQKVCSILSELSGFDFEVAEDMVEATQDAGVFVMVSGVLKRIAVKLSKTSNDLRLLSSGPRAGLDEINLPARQAGSSIMPGKVNPVMCEMLIQTCLYVRGLCHSASLCGTEGAFELNVSIPLMAHALHESIRCLGNASRVFADRCVEGIEVDGEQCEASVRRSLMLVTALNPHIGYDKAAAVAKRAFTENKTLREVVLEEGLMAADELDRVLDPRTMVGPSSL